MTERGILFSAPMVLALLAGTKTQTRRLVKPQPDEDGLDRIVRPNPLPYWHDSSAREYHCPYGLPGDRLYVKEAAWMWCERQPHGVTKTGRPKWLYVPLQSAPITFAADHPSKPGTLVVSPDTGNAWAWRMKVARFLPKWASRITLEVTSVRVERLQDISDDDALDEGISRDGLSIIRGSARQRFAELWDQINGAKAPWSTNPWLWVVGFRRLP